MACFIGLSGASRSLIGWFNGREHADRVKQDIDKGRDANVGADVAFSTAPLNGTGCKPSTSIAVGRYFEDCREARIVSARPTDFSGGVAPYALDPANAERLWGVASALTTI